MSPGAKRVFYGVCLLVVVMGFLFILRGMGLGIPYLSPELMDTAAFIPLCK